MNWGSKTIKSAAIMSSANHHAHMLPESVTVELCYRWFPVKIVLLTYTEVFLVDEDESGLSYITSI